MSWSVQQLSLRFSYFSYYSYFCILSFSPCSIRLSFSLSWVIVVYLLNVNHPKNQLQAVHFTLDSSSKGNTIINLKLKLNLQTLGLALFTVLFSHLQYPPTRYSWYYIKLILGFSCVLFFRRDRSTLFVSH